MVIALSIEKKKGDMRLHHEEKGKVTMSGYAKQSIQLSPLSHQEASAGAPVSAQRHPSPSRTAFRNRLHVLLSRDPTLTKGSVHRR